PGAGTLALSHRLHRAHYRRLLPPQRRADPRWPAPQWMRLSGRRTARRLTPGAPVQNLRTRGGCSYGSRGTPGLGVGESLSWWCSCDNASAPSGAEVGAAYFGVGQQLLSAALHDDAAVLHDVAPVGQFQRLVGVLFDQED